MRYIASLLAGLGMYIVGVMLWDVFGWLYLESRLRPEHFVVAQAVFRADSKWDDFYAMLPMIIGRVIPIAAFATGFFWTFRRTSTGNPN